MHDFFAVVSTATDMNLREIVKELHAENLVPVIVLGDGERTILPLFRLQSVAAQFLRRNLDRKWVAGTLGLSDEDLACLTGKGWDVEWMDWPKKVKDRYEVRIEVVQLDLSYDLFAAHGRPRV